LRWIGRGEIGFGSDDAVAGIGPAKVFTPVDYDL
jgi:hypothetical protein